MKISALDLFKIGLGPSSSHTVGPMKAARRFAESLQENGHRDATDRIQTTLFGSLGATGRGHATDVAVQLGLEGERPEDIDPNTVPDALERIRREKQLRLLGGDPIRFDPEEDLRFDGSQCLEFHPNGMRFTARDAAGGSLCEEDYFSLGGGFVLSKAETTRPADQACPAPKVAYPFGSGAELLDHCRGEDLSISQLMLANEAVWRPEAETRTRLLEVWSVMQAAAERGMQTSGELPGRLGLKRRAPELRAALEARPAMDRADPLAEMDWIDLYALAIGEENAAGGRVVTAPTNGAAALIPAVLHYATRLPGHGRDEEIVSFLLTASAVGALYKENASLSAADVGCQGEVGVACSMAAAALAEFLGGSPEQALNAAEIGMEHNLGLTCDPIGGLVQIPCIERNAMGAIKAINAARMALRRSSKPYVSLDEVIRTMKETGADMLSKYKETAEGGLAVNVPEC